MFVLTELWSDRALTRTHTSPFSVIETRYVRPSARPSAISHPHRIVQLGFLTTAARFLRQAETLQDERAEDLLSHGLWCLSLNLTEVRCPAPPLPAIEPADVARQGSSRALQGQDGKPSVHEGKLSVAGRTGSKRFTTRSGDPQEAPGPHHQKGTRAGQEETPEVTKSATSLRNRALPRSGSSAVVWGADKASVGSAAVSNDVDGSGWAGSAFGRTGGEARGAEGGFGVAGEGGTRAERGG